LNSKASKIKLTVEDGDPSILVPKELIINALGLENVTSLRNAMDGVTHFGSRPFFNDNTVSNNQDQQRRMTRGFNYNDYVFEDAEGQHSVG
jgi:hypothetical protein